MHLFLFLIYSIQTLILDFGCTNSKLFLKFETRVLAHDVTATPGCIAAHVVLFLKLNILQFRVHLINQWRASLRS